MLSHSIADALFDLAIDSKLRGCDVVKVKIGDLVLGGQIRTRAIVVQAKTGKPVQFELLHDARTSLLAWLERRGGALTNYVFPSRIDHADHLSTRQYARLVDEWVVGVGLRREEYGTYSLRRTMASIIYRATADDRGKQRRSLAGPASKGRAVEINALCRHHLRLEVEREMVVELGDDHVRQGGERRLALGDRLGRRGRLVCAACSLTRSPPSTAQSSLQSNWKASPGAKTRGTNVPRPLVWASR